MVERNLKHVWSAAFTAVASLAGAHFKYLIVRVTLLYALSEEQQR